ncbi:MAG: phosphate starvation-inducible protein PhoH [Rhodobacteraceae bacterium]|nr:MAG: phosphate starvation-inducible protein PhoH [Paracoccaceae bacterium]|tara:strand:+ start:4243 stop:5262 length:1020 start_codon:yes stop_codon:yes gene_type:complete
MVILSNSKNFQRIIEFPDNRLMIDLCGQLDSNLSKIEHEISVQIHRRGNLFEISGDQDDCGLATMVLQSLYSQLESGKCLEPGDIDATIRMPSEFFESDFRKNVNGNNHIKPSNSLFEIVTRKKTILPRTVTQKLYAKSLLDGDLTFGVGPAGTGKTYLAIAVGVSLYLTGGADKIILTRPAVEAGERLGFLPGDMKEKVDPYMQPLYDALQDCLPGQQITKMLEAKIIEIAPLAFMRGRTLSNAFVVLDEAQNTTEMQMKMFLTRLGENSRMVITGDPSQIDLPRGTKSGLLSAIKILKGVKGINFSLFNSDDVVRHQMVTRIIKAYEAFEKSEREES